MKHRLRGVIAALSLSSAVTLAFPATPAPAIAGPELAPGETTLSDGLTTEVRHATGSGAVALEVWVRCPADGWSSTQPGIARLTALAVLAAKDGGTSLRDAVRARGGQLGISIFQTATEFAVLSPADQAPALEDALVRAVFRPVIDGAALDDARTRLAAEQADSAQSSQSVLRDKVFAAMFSTGPLHDSTLGDSQLLQTATLNDVRDFAARSYVASASAVVALGNGDTAALNAHLAPAAPAASTALAIPDSPIATAPAQPIQVTSPNVDVPGVALAWTGPPITDERAATAMDFLSDYLADQQSGTFALAASATTAGSAIQGQFVTLERPGVFFVTASGTGVDPATMETALRGALDPVLARPLARDQFSRAIAAYETRLLRQMDSPQGLADNYGWYFAQDAPAYAPSATDATMGGAYFAAAASLTPDFVHDVARRYLGAAPIVVDLAPVKASTAQTSGGQ